MKPSEYVALDGIGLAGLIRSGEVSRAEVAETAIALALALNPELNAIVMTDFDAARRQAALGGPEGGGPEGVVAGVPFLLKDVYQQSDGMATTYACRYLIGTAAQPDSTMVRRWREAGLVILGKTNTPEFAAEFVTEPKAYGVTRNPWDRTATVGGSSGGAAAAVAAGIVPFAHATDLGGSIRVPSACCATYGLKPTSGLNPVGPYLSEVAHGLNSDHVISRTVRDSAASLDITANPEKSARGFLNGHRIAPARLKILASVHAADGSLAGLRQVKAVERTVDMLRGLGHEVTLLDRSPLVPVGGWVDLLWADDIPPILAARQKECGRPPRRDELEPLTWFYLAELQKAGPDGLNAALKQRQKVAAAHLDLFLAHDILLTPTLAQDPVPVGTLGFNDHATPETWFSASYGFAPFSILANITGQPAASLPLPLDAGPPVGVQLMAAPGRDLLVLQLSAQLEPLFDWAGAYRLHWQDMTRRFGVALAEAQVRTASNA